VALTDSTRGLVKIAGKRVLLNGKASIPAVGRFASLEGLTVKEVFDRKHPLLDQFIDCHKGSKKYHIIAPAARISAPQSATCMAIYKGLDQKAVQQRAVVYNGLALPPPVLRAYLAGAFDDVDSVTHAKTRESQQLTASKRSLVGHKRVTGQMLVPAVGEFAAFGRCTIATAFGVEHALLDQFIKQTGVDSRGSPFFAIVSTTSSNVKSVRSSVYSGLTLDAVQQRAEMYNGLALRLAVLRAYLAGAFDDVDSVTHAKTGEAQQLTASKRSLVGQKNAKRVSGQMLVPAVGEFAAFGRCTIATAFGVEHPLLDEFIKQTGVDSRGSRYCAIATRAVKPRQTAMSAKRRRGKSTATAPSHGLMTPLLLPPTTQPAKHAKLVVPPGHHPHPCATY
jgi:hypothetical protein